MQQPPIATKKGKAEPESGPGLDRKRVLEAELDVRSLRFHFQYQDQFTLAHLDLEDGHVLSVLSFLERIARLVRSVKVGHHHKESHSDPIEQPHLKSGDTRHTEH